MDQPAYEMTLRAGGKENKTILQENHSRITDEEMYCGPQANEWTQTGKSNADAQSPKSRKCDGSTSPLLTVKEDIRQPSSSSSSSSSSTTESPSSSQESNLGVDCAGFILKCLFCRFYDILLMLPDFCERVVDHYCPTYKQFSSTMESPCSDENTSNMDCDWGLCNLCEDASDCLELAMELSEICYH